MSKLLENKKFLTPHIKIIYTLSNIKLYPKCQIVHNSGVGLISFIYGGKFDIYPYSNAAYKGKINFESQKELIKNILRMVK